MGFQPAGAIILAVIALTSPPTARAALPPTPDLTAGRLHFTLVSGAKMRLWVDGVPVITDAHLYLVKPGWTGVLLNTDEIKPTLTQATEGDAQVVTADYESADGYARYRFELRANDTLTEHLTFGTKNGVPAEIEYAAGYVNADVIAGEPFTADTIVGSKFGTVAPFALSAGEEASRVTPDLFRSMRFDSRLGPFTITVSGSTPATSALNLFDTRKQTEDWATRNPMFWLGIGAPPLTASAGDSEMTMTFAFGPAPHRDVAVPPPAGSLRVVPLKAARTPTAPDLPLIPKPKEMEIGVTPLRLLPGARIVIPASPIAEEKAGADELRAELHDYWSLTLPIVVGVPPRPGDICLGRAAILHAAAPERPEGYSIHIDAKGATLAGHDARGVYDAVQTFKQLIRVDATGVVVKPVVIRDWPTLLWRGVQWYGGPHSFPFHERMIDRILGPLKYNKMVLQAEYTAWDSLPKVRDTERTTPKAETAKSIACARGHFLEPIPLVPSLGHMEWMFHNGQNRDIVADPKVPYTIDPENPRSYDVLFGVYSEVIDLFHPTNFHIGHDEVAMIGTFPKSGSKKTMTELFVRNANTVHDWLAQRHIGTIMWGDELLDASEGNPGNAAGVADAAARRAGIPKDTIVADWHYSGADFPSLAVLRRAGFRTLASTWYNPTSLRGFAREAAKQDSLGLLQTTWAGYSMSLDQVKGESFPQFVAYLIGAEQAWNGGANGDQAALGYDPSQAFLALWDRKPVDRSTHAGFTTNLSSAANSAWWSWLPTSTSAMSAAAITPPFPAGQTIVDGIRFTVDRPVWFSGALNPAGSYPDRLTIPLHARKASTLALLWGTAFAAQWNSRIARLTIAYADGSTADSPIVYGRQIAAFTEKRTAPDTTRAWSGIAPSGDTLAVGLYQWANPRPDTAIESVTITSDGTEAAPVLIGLSGIE